MAKGFGLDIPNDFLDKIELADKKIKQLATTSEDTKRRIVSSFQEMGNVGVQSFINKLDEAQRKLASLSATPIKINWGSIDLTPLANLIQQLSGSKSTTVKIQGIDIVGQQASSAVDAVNKLIMALSQLSQAGGSQFLSSMTAIGRNSFRDLNREARKMINTIGKLDQAISSYSITAQQLSDKINEARQAQERFNEIAKRQARGDVSNLLSQRGGQTTLNELKQYASDLKRTMANLDPKSQEWLRLNSIFKDTTKRINEINQSMKNYQKEHRNIMDISGQLQRRLALMFSVSQVMGYIKKMVEVRGEFEIQQKSLEVLLKNKEEANRLWEQTTELAVKSPFRVKELVTYTRQLAAYRIEAEDLHETTKRLADVSAGLGVDMNRLILAYGQVRAANFLRGTELRQFTEAGIPMLDELAKHFSELEGRAISAGDVFAMISKRMVSFQDVAKVFEKMTSEGGTFFEMQEEQSKTLKGMISNLSDSIDLMLNEIGKSEEGFMKGTINTLKNMVESYEEITKYALPLLVVLTTRWALLKGEMILTSGVLKGLSATMMTSLKAVWVQLQGVTIGFKQSTAAAKALAKGTPGASLFGGWVTVLSAIAFVGWEVYNLITSSDNALKELNKNVKENKAQLEKQTNTYEDLVSRISLVNKGSQEHKEIISKLNSQYGQYLGFIVDENTQYAQLYQNIGKVTHALTQKAKMSVYEQTYSASMKGVFENISKEEDFITKHLQEGFKIIDKKGLTNRIIPTKQEINDIFNLIKNQVRETGNAITSHNDISKIIQEYYNVKEETALQGVSITRITDLTKYYIKQKEIELELEKKINDEFNTRAASTAEARNEMNKYEEERKKALKSAESSPKWEQERLKKAWDLKKVDIEGRYESLDEDVIEKRKAEILKTNKTIDDINKKIEASSKTLGEKFASRIYIDEQEASTGISQIAEQTAQAYKIQKELANQQEKLREAGTVHNEEELQSALQLANAYKFKLQLLGREDLLQKDINKEESKELTLLNKQLSALKEARNAYKENRKLYNKEDATKKTLSAYQPLFNELKIGDITKDIDFEVEGVIDVLDKLPNAAGERGEQAIQKLRSGFMSELGDFEKELENKNFIQSIENLFDNYQISLELEKLNIPTNLAKRLFGVDSIDLSEIRNEIENKLSLAKATKGGLDVVKDLESQLKKVNDLEEDALVERLKRYTKYLNKGQTERLKVKLEELRQIAQLEEDYQNKKIGKQDKELAEKGFQNEAKKALDKIEFEEFKESELYLLMFEDLDAVSTRVLNSMQKKLQDLKKNLTDLDPSDFNTIIKQINKIDDEINNRRPFDVFTKDLKNYIKFLKERNSLEEDFLNQQAKEDSLRVNVKQQESGISDLQIKYETISKDSKATQQQKDNAYLELTLAKEHLNILLNQLLAEEKITEEQADRLRNGKKDEKQFYEKLADAGSKLSEIGSSLPQMQSHLENMGIPFSDGLSDAIETTSEAFTGLGSALQGFASGNYIQGVMGVLQTLGALFQVGDKKKERQIQKEIELVEKLAKQYEKLEKQINETYNIETFDAANKNAEANLEQQITATKKMIALEEDKKKADEDKIKEYKEQLDELNDKLEELEANRIQSLGGFGSKEAYKSASQEFVDAWIEAYKETGDGLAGLEEQFDEFFLNMVKKQVLMRGIDKFLDPFYEAFDSMFSEDSDMGSKVSKEETAKMKEQWENTMPELSDFIESLVESMGVATDLRKSSDELSGLQRGIQGVTESTAQIIEGYLNSIRFFVAEKHRILSDFITNFNNPEVDNPLLSQLKIIATQTSNIHELLNSLTTPHPTLAGRGLKVVI